MTNIEVLERINPEMSLEGKITRLKLTYFGRVTRASSLEKEMLLGMVSGERKQGRPKTRWLDTIKNDTGMNIKRYRPTWPPNVLRT